MGMINLLPKESKKQLRAAHTNVALARYLALLSAGIIFLILACVVSYFILLSISNTNEEAKENQQSTNDSYNTAKAQFDQMAASMQTASGIMNKQVLFSNIITGLASALPLGVIVDNLTVSAESISTPITIKAYAVSDSSVSTLRTNLKSPLFSSSEVQTMTNSQGNAVGYPIAITITITINKGAVQ
jgi:Tfp pilus assembly protein PilN